MPHDMKGVCWKSLLNLARLYTNLFPGAQTSELFMLMHKYFVYPIITRVPILTNLIAVDSPTRLVKFIYPITSSM